MDTYQSAQTATFQPSSNQSNKTRLLQDLEQHYAQQEEAMGNRTTTTVDQQIQSQSQQNYYGGNSLQASSQDLVNMTAHQQMQAVIFEEEDGMASSENIEFRNPHAASLEEDLSDTRTVEVLDDNASPPAHLQMNYLEYKKDASQQVESRQSNTGDTQQQQQRTTDEAMTSHSPSCYRAVLAAASTHLYRSSHCSTYQNNQFDADDEFDEQHQYERESYTRLLQSHNSLPQTPLPSKPLAPAGVLQLVKSPSENFMHSISEEQSTRKNNHLKISSLQELSKEASDMAGQEMNSARVIQTHHNHGSLDSDRRSFSLLNKDEQSQEQKNPNKNDHDIQDSLQMDPLSPGLAKKPPCKSTTTYQDSLDSYTPKSQRMPAESLTPVINPGTRTDTYDVRNKSHKQYFMPQAYPPRRSQNCSKSPDISNTSIILDASSQKAAEDKAPKEKLNLQGEKKVCGGSQDQISDLSPSFRQQTFKPVELKKYMGEQRSVGRQTPDPIDTSYEGGLSHTNTKSVQELHNRNNELQSRIGNLEKMLMSRLAEKEGSALEAEKNDTTLKAFAPSMISHQPPQVQNQSLSHRSCTLSFVNTEDPATVQGQIEAGCSSHRLNDEPILRTDTSRPAHLSARHQGMASHRSAAEIIKMHYDQFKTQQLDSNGSSVGYTGQRQKVGNTIYGSYVLTTEDTQTQQAPTNEPSAHETNSNVNSVAINYRQAWLQQQNDQEKAAFMTKRQMNIMSDNDDQVEEESQGSMLAETDADECAHQQQQPRHKKANSNGPITEDELQRQEQKNYLLGFLQNQNAETLKAIQHENSTFILQQRGERDQSILSVDLQQTQQELKRLDDKEEMAGCQQSEFQTTTIHEVNNDSMVDNTQKSLFNDGSCEKCCHVFELNEALQEENERLRDHMESMIVLVQQFDIDRTKLIDQNNVKIDSLEQKIGMLQSQQNSAQVSLSRDQEETIKCLKDHIKSLERTNFNNELSVISANGHAVSKSQLTQGQSDSRPLSPVLASHQKTQQQDKEWQSRVGMLERELKETKDFYLQRIETLEKGNNVFTDQSIIVPEEHADSPNTMNAPVFCHTFEHHRQRVSQEGPQSQSMECVPGMTVEERNQLYEKLQMAEQVLEQVTEELGVLAGENKFLTKLNQRLTYHACRQEKYFLDWRKQSLLGHSQLKQSKRQHHSRDMSNSLHLQSSYAPTQSEISSQEVVLSKDISKERVTQVVSMAESMLKSSVDSRHSKGQHHRHNHHHHQSRKERPANRNQQTKEAGQNDQKTPKDKDNNNKAREITNKQAINECIETLEIVKDFIQQKPVEFADKLSLQQQAEKSSYLKQEQFEKVLAQIKAPVSRVEMRRLFHFLYSGLKDASEPQAGEAPHYVAITDICKILGQAPNRQQQRANERERSHDAVPTKQEASEDHLKRQNATIESSDARTFGTSHIFSDSLASVVHTKKTRMSAFYEQNPLQTNSIIQLEDQLRKQEYVKEVTANNSRNYNGAAQPESDIQNETTGGNNKIEQLKKRIERMSRQAKMSRKAVEPVDLNRSISEDRATQTISGSNQYKRGNRATSKELQTCK